MRKLLLDTSVYIPLLREGRMPGRLIEAPEYLLYLSAVVAQELYAGSMDAESDRHLDEICETFRKSGRFVFPDDEEWMECGRVLAKAGKKHGYPSIRKGRLVNDVLIALTSRRIDATLVTRNIKDFQMIQDFVDFLWIGA